MSKILHILETRKDAPSKSICGELGQTIYNPIKSNCNECIKYFKSFYPES